MKDLGCILLAEDNDDEIERVRRALIENRITNKLEVVSDGPQVVDFVLRRGTFAGRDTETDPCLVMLDAEVPGVDAVEVLEHLRAEDGSRDIPVAVIVGSNEERHRVEDRELGPVGFITKPFGYDGLLDAAEQLGVYWSILDQKPPYIFAPHSEV